MATKTNGLVFPKIPKDKDYEDYISSLLACGDLFLERGIHCFKDSEELLELDIVSTKFNKDKIEKTLIEIKSGKSWGYPEIFKVYGWQQFLDIKKAAFIVQIDKDDSEITKEHCKDYFNIDLIVDKQSDDEKKLDDKEIIEKFALDKKKLQYQYFFRIAYGLESEMFLYLKARSKSFEGEENDNGYKYLENYFSTINSQSFFCHDEVTRINTLVSAFKKNNHITARLGVLEETGHFPEEALKIPENIFTKIQYEAETVSPLYMSLYIEHLGRLLLLKTCISDYFEPNKDDIFNILSHDNLPWGLHLTIDSISDEKYFYYYPYFWQVFTYLFGGFLLTNHIDEEYKLLSEITNIPIDEIPRALASFDKFFPLGEDKSWFFQNSKTHIKMLKSFPLPFAGIGVYFRAVKFENETSVSATEYLNYLENETHDYTVSDMRKWVLLLKQFLEKGNRYK